MSGLVSRIGDFLKDPDRAVQVSLLLGGSLYLAGLGTYLGFQSITAPSPKKPAQVEAQLPELPAETVESTRKLYKQMYEHKPEAFEEEYQKALLRLRRQLVPRKAPQAPTPQPTSSPPPTPQPMPTPSPTPTPNPQTPLFAPAVIPQPTLIPPPPPTRELKPFSPEMSPEEVRDRIEMIYEGHPRKVIEREYKRRIEHLQSSRAQGASHSTTQPGNETRNALYGAETLDQQIARNLVAFKGEGADTPENIARTRAKLNLLHQREAESRRRERVTTQPPTPEDDGFDLSFGEGFPEGFELQEAVPYVRDRSLNELYIIFDDVGNPQSMPNLEKLMEAKVPFIASVMPHSTHWRRALRKLANYDQADVMIHLPMAPVATEQIDEKIDGHRLTIRQELEAVPRVGTEFDAEQNCAIYMDDLPSDVAQRVWGIVEEMNRVLREENPEHVGVIGLNNHMGDLGGTKEREPLVQKRVNKILYTLTSVLEGYNGGGRKFFLVDSAVTKSRRVYDAGVAAVIPSVRRNFGFIDKNDRSETPEERMRAAYNSTLPRPNRTVKPTLTIAHMDVDASVQAYIDSAKTMKNLALLRDLDPSEF